MRKLYKHFPELNDVSFRKGMGSRKPITVRTGVNGGTQTRTNH